MKNKKLKYPIVFNYLISNTKYKNESFSRSANIYFN